MFSRFNLSSLLGALALLALAPSAAHASPFKGEKDMPFDAATRVSDQELSKMRGGFLDINGVLIDLSFLSRVQVGLDIQSYVNVNNLTDAAANASQLQQLLQPNIITNVDPNTLISIQQAMNISILNPSQLAALQSIQQFGFQNGLGH